MYEGELEGGGISGLDHGVGGLLLSPAGPLSIPGGASTRVRHSSGQRRSTATATTHSRSNSIGSNDNNNNNNSNNQNWQDNTVTPTTPRDTQIRVDDPSTYIHKRGSLPVSSAARRFFGWDAPRAPVAGGSGAGGRGKVAKKAASMRELRGSERADDGASFIDLRGTRGGFARGLSLRGSAKDGRAKKRESLLRGIVPMGGGVEEVAGASAGGGGIVRRLTTRAQAASRPDGKRASVSPAAHAHSSTQPRRFSFAANNDSTNAGAPESPSALAFCLGRGFGRQHRARYSGSSEAAGVEGSETAARTVQLKKSFKLGVGRTMGPRLTLAVASSSLPRDEDAAGVDGWRAHHAEGLEEGRALEMATMGETIREDDDRSTEREDSQEGYGDEEGDEEEGDLQSVAAARLVSASIARSTPAATILAAPATPSRSGYRISYASVPSGYSLSPTQEALPSLVTSSPALPTPPAQSPTSVEAASSNAKSRRTSGSMWKPHPFADPSDEAEYSIRLPVRAQTLEIVRVGADDDDDVLRLEHEMEEMRGSTDHREADNEKALRDFHAALNQVSARPLSDSGKVEDVKLLGNLGGHAQTRTSLSAPPVPKSNWAPQASTTAGFPYRFPIIFGSSTGSSSGSGSPPRPHVALSPPGHSSQPNSTLGTPRGPSTLRLSSRTMDTVRNAFAGVGARMSRMSIIAHSVGGPVRSGGMPEIVGGSVSEDSDGDFMDLRDPFASPPAVAKVSSASTKHAPKTGTGDSSREWTDGVLVIDAEGESVAGGSRGERRTRRRMSAWGRLPMPARTLSPVPSSAGGGSVSASTGKRSSVGTKTRASRGKSTTKKSKKERRSRKVTLPSMAGTLISTKSGAAKTGEEEADFGLEEALLSQRLLKRLDSAEWEIRG